MEGSVFPASAVAEILKNEFVEARLHTDGGPAKDANKALQESMTGSVANPIYVLYDPVTAKSVAQRAGYVFEKDFVEFLKTR